jgi:hypothetical protein
MNLQLSDLWTAAGVLLGFQVTAFAWRISHEADVADRGDVSWIPLADFLNLIAMVVTAVGCFVLPGSSLVSIQVASKLLGLSTILFVGHSFSLAAHYELFNPRTKRTYRYFPPQERVAVFSVSVAAVMYLAVAFFQSGTGT